jgi:hypothetical protein
MALKLMAWMVRAAIETRTTNLAEWAVPIKPQVQTDSTYRRIQAFFEKFTLEKFTSEKFTPNYEALSRFPLDLVPTDPPYTVVLDRTERHFGSKAMNALVAGVAHGGTADPVAWTVLDHGGGSGAAGQVEVGDRLMDPLDPDDIRVVVADREVTGREVTGADWIEALAERTVPFVLRLKSGGISFPCRGVRAAHCPLYRVNSKRFPGPPLHRSPLQHSDGTAYLRCGKAI